MIVYDHSFNQNEWFIIIVLVLGYIAVFITNHFSFKIKAFLLVYGIYVGFFFDHTISVGPFNFYDVNDSSGFQLLDILSYFMYGPFSYFFIYIWEKFNVKRKYSFLYITCWSLVSIMVEGFAHYLGVYHYRGHYKIYYSFCTYPVVQWILLKTYTKIKIEEKVSDL